ncbi:MAG: hypothetical protein GY811_23465 [Myxococcales bacterium]|nr:hypothetical protein [Myxococcales bacterium]
MGDLYLKWGNGSADLVLLDDDLEADDGLRTAILLSLFTDRRADQGDELPGGEDDRRGWWGDEFLQNENDRMGSKLWMLERSTITENLVPSVERHALQALEWLIDDGVASSVDVLAEVDGDRVSYLVSIGRPGEDLARFKFEHAREGEGSRTSPFSVGNVFPVLGFSVEVNALTVTATDESTDSNVEIILRFMNWGDGSGSEELTGEGPWDHEYPNEGSFSATLTVTDGGGYSDDVTVEFYIALDLAGIDDITSGNILAAAMGYEFAPLAMGRMNESSGDTDLMGIADLSDVGTPTHESANVTLGTTTTLFDDGSTDALETTDNTLLDVGDESVAVLIYCDIPSVPALSRTMIGKKPSSASSTGGFAIYITNTGQINWLCCADDGGVFSQAIRGVLGDHSGGKILALGLNNQDTDYTGLMTQMGTSVAFPAKVGTLTNAAEFSVGAGTSRTAPAMSGALWAIWRGVESEGIGQEHFDALLDVVGPATQVYLLLGHSIIVGSANLGNVGPEFAYLDDPITGLEYSELIDCPDDDGVGSCSTETSWATFDGAGSFGPELTMGRYISENSVRTSRIIKCATNGTDFANDWNPSAVAGHMMYSRATAFIDARLAEISGRYVVAGVLIADGTNDVIGGGDPSLLEEAYTGLISSLRAKYGSQMKVAISRINSDTTMDAIGRDVARAASDSIAGASADNVLIDMDGLGLVGDGIHPDTLAQITYGELAGAALITPDP